MVDSGRSRELRPFFAPLINSWKKWFSYQKLYSLVHVHVSSVHPKNLNIASTLAVYSRENENRFEIQLFSVRIFQLSSTYDIMDSTLSSFLLYHETAHIFLYDKNLEKAEEEKVANLFALNMMQNMNEKDEEGIKRMIADHKVFSERA